VTAARQLAADAVATVAAMAVDTATPVLARTRQMTNNRLAVHVLRKVVGVTAAATVVATAVVVLVAVTAVEIAVATAAATTPLHANPKVSLTRCAPAWT
jgi:hypothetical protein